MLNFSAEILPAMLHFELVPFELWIALALLAALYFGNRWRQNRARAAKRARITQRHRRNVAHQRAWRWVFGRSRAPRLPDLRDQPQD